MKPGIKHHRSLMPMMGQLRPEALPVLVAIEDVSARPFPRLVT
jgi:hypothetical protein